MAELQYKMTNDLLFKMIFTQRQDLLQSLVSELLGIRAESIKDFTVTNTEIPPESLTEKLCRLDINMLIDGVRVGLEIQVRDEGDFRDRSLFHWARQYASSVKRGGGYDELLRTIQISILGFTLFECDEYHSEFCALEVHRHTLLTDKMALHFYELPKLESSYCKENLLELWLLLFKATTKEEHNQILALGVPAMTDTIETYNRITTSTDFQELERMREKAELDYNTAMSHAKKSGIQIGEQRGEQRGIQIGEQRGIQVGAKQEKLKIAKNLLHRDMSIEAITQITGLTPEEIQSL